MRERYWNNILWREWASGDYADSAYRRYLFKLVAREQGGAKGGILLGLALGVWTLLAGWLSVLVVVATYASLHEYSVSWALLQTVRWSVVAIIACSALGVLVGSISRWWITLYLVFCLLLSLAVCATRLCNSDDDDVLVGCLIGMAVLATPVGAIAWLLGWSATVVWALIGVAAVVALWPSGVFVAAVIRSRHFVAGTCASGSFLCFWWWRRPDLHSLEEALRNRGDHRIRKALRAIETASLQPDELPDSIERLSSSSWRDRLVARQVCIRFGGLAIDALNSRRDKLWEVAAGLKSRICRDTRRRLRRGKFLCPDCLTRAKKHRVGPWKFWGCRICRRGHGSLVSTGRVIAVLDRHQARRVRAEGEDVYINLFKAKKGCDFDEVRIAGATDEQVEAFATEAANEIDPQRRALIQKATCCVSAACGLRENTIRILRHTFGRVRVSRFEPPSSESPHEHAQELLST